MYGCVIIDASAYTASLGQGVPTVSGKRSLAGLLQLVVACILDDGFKSRLRTNTKQISSIRPLRKLRIASTACFCTLELVVHRSAVLYGCTCGEVCILTQGLHLVGPEIIAKQ